MSNQIVSKTEMYRLLNGGHFGNTNPTWTCLAAWEKSSTRDRYPLWGVRSFTPNDPRARLNIPTADVPTWVGREFPSGGWNVSPMITSAGGNVLWEGDVWRDETGLHCSGNLSPDPGSWRRHMLRPRQWNGSAAAALLQNVLNSNSFSDLEDLLDRYSSVVELSACDFCLGTVPGRNAVIWEVRNY